MPIIHSLGDQTPPLCDFWPPGALFFLESGQIPHIRFRGVLKRVFGRGSVFDVGQPPRPDKARWGCGPLTGVRVREGWSATAASMDANGQTSAANGQTSSLDRLGPSNHSRPR